MNILITGGAGFVGSTLATYLKKEFPKSRIIALDNLKRRGSELNLKRLANVGVEFVHGDVRCPEDLMLDAIDWVIECSAEPSALSGLDGDTAYLVHTNLLGTYNCLELAKRCKAGFIFLSTSRVYPYTTLSKLDLSRINGRFEYEGRLKISGLSSQGVSEDFSISGAKTLYGASKLASELLITEYAQSFEMKTIINRCGVLAGPWQMGKVDQGFMTLWMARHIYGGKLSFLNYGGLGLQVRDVLHINDLADLVVMQINNPKIFSGEIFNVGGGYANSISLLELTKRCEVLTKKFLNIQGSDESRLGDLPWFITDHSNITRISGWAPRSNLDSIIEDIYSWLVENRSQLESILR